MSASDDGRIVHPILAEIHARPTDPGVAAAARQERRIEQPTDDRALVRAGAKPSPLAENYARRLNQLLTEWSNDCALKVRAFPIDGVPTAFHITGIGDEPGAGPTLLVHVMEVNR